MSNNFDNEFKKRKSSRKSFTKYLLSIVASVLILSFVSVAAYLFGVSYVTRTNIFTHGIESFNKSVSNFRKISLVMSELNDKYIGEVDNDSLVGNALVGMVDSLEDPYSRYIFDDFEYFGIGIGYKVRNNKVLVTHIQTGSLAERSGIHVGDHIVSVSGKEIDVKNISKMTPYFLKNDGDNISIGVERNGEIINIEVFNITEVLVDTVEEKNDVEYKKINDDIVYIKINLFKDGVYDTFKSTVETLKPKGIIIDVRDNGGGISDEAAKISSEFLPEGSIINFNEYKNGIMEEFKAKKGIAEDVELVVLGNSGSASASELLIGSFVGNNIGTFVGEKTYGKGVGQTSIHIDGGDMLFLTIFKSNLPDGSNINGIGIKPDVEVIYDKETYENNKEIANGDKDLLLQLDPQYQKALEIIKEKIK